MSLRTRIILVMVGVLVVSLIGIGFVSLEFFTRQNEKYHQERLARKEKAIKTDMAYFSKEVEVQESSDIVIKEFEEEVLRLTTIHGIDISVYNTHGDLLVAGNTDSSHTSAVLKVPPAAMEQLAMVDRVVLPSNSDNKRVLSDFTVLRNSKGERIAILHLPYKQESTVSQVDIQGFLSTIGATYLFLFALAIIITLLLSNSVTRNLRALTDSMQHVDFGSTNAPLKWKKNDEIGLLISSYNEMLHKLEESRNLLAKKEREGAWREMARQVAHEIKNPLTPIKLSIQHLQATAAYDSPDWREKFTKTMGMIIQQIESLNRIASEFSDFAKMPKPHLEVCVLKKLVDEVLLLFTEDKVDIIKNMPKESVSAKVDADGIRRVLGNLIRNAVHAVAEKQHPKIQVSLLSESEYAHLIVEDNGIGISEDQKDKIFQPNFTTKSSGTGLGLAICQQLIEQAGGEIWFESELGQFSRFHVRIPLNQ